MAKHPDNKLSISIIIPAFNEEKRIRKTLNKIISYIKTKKYLYEIIVVDDGSSDATAKIISTYKDKNVYLLKNSKNMGKGYSVSKGMLKARYDYVLFTDSDLSTPIEELGVFIDMLIENKQDIIVGSRAVRGADVKLHQPFYREFSGKTFNLLVRLFLGLKIHDTQCGFKLFRKYTVKKIFPLMTVNRFGFDVEVLFIAKKHKLKVFEQPVVWINNSQTTVRLFKDSFRMFWDIFYIIFNNMTRTYD